MQRWRGLKALVVDSVEHGSRAVERVHLETANIPFSILERVPPLERPAKGVHLAHDLVTKGVYGAIRLVNLGVSAALDVALDVAEGSSQREPSE